MLSAIACRFGWHRPDRNAILFDGRSPRAPCLGCGIVLERGRNGWRRPPDAGDDISSLLTPPRSD